MTDHKIGTVLPQSVIHDKMPDLVANAIRSGKFVYTDFDTLVASYRAVTLNKLTLKDDRTSS